MRVWEAVVVVVVVGIVTYVAAAQQDDIKLISGGYSGVAVAISDQLDGNYCSQYINNIKLMFETASQLMFTATGGKVFFADVVIVVPQAWGCEGETLISPELTYSWDSAHIRVGPSHYLFGDNPWTQQLGGCGDPGDWIYLPENFLLNNTDFGSPGNVLVHEWAKYRWGVFEEYGHTNDTIFPAVYRNESNIFTPTYCTDNLLEGVMSCPEGGAESECQFTPELSPNTTVTSSLLAAPFINTVVKFCDAGSHNAEAPTKHNLLCEQNSAWDVMHRHEDLTGVTVSFASTSFSLVRAGADGPRLVLLVDYNSVMGEIASRWPQLRDTVRQFIKVEAAAETYMGFVLFNGTDVTIYYPVVPLNEYNNRETIASLIPNDRPTQGKKNLYSAITKGVELLGAEGGTLVLLTDNLEEYQDNQDLSGAAANNPVWPILYPNNASYLTTVYDQLASISPDTSVLTVPDDRFNFNGFEHQSVTSSADLHSCLLTAAASPKTLVTSGSCNTRSCNIPLRITNSTSYISPAYIKVFWSAAETGSGFITVTVMEPSGTIISSGIVEGTNDLFEINSLQDGEYVVIINLYIDTLLVVAEFWATPAAPLGLQVSVWSPQGLHDLQYSPGLAPRLLAKVTNSASWPVLLADVKAQVAVKNAIDTPVNITLNDGGTGGDVTGHDGVYSGYLVGFEPNVDVTITLTVTDNDGKAAMVNPSLRAAPTTPESVVCCGSQLDVSHLQLDVLGDFEISSAAVSGRMTGVSPGTLPPGRVTDLQASRTGYDVTLTFTAPGAKLDQGDAEGYELRYQAVNEKPHATNVSGLPAGSPVEATIGLPGCDKVYTFTVEAYYAGVRGSTSNSVREIVLCSDTNQLSAGAIAGITIGCIFGVLLIVLIIYLCLNRDHLDDLWVWKILTCRCLMKKKEEDLYNAPSQARRTDVIRSNTTPLKPVRDLTDLYTRPNTDDKRESHQRTTQVDDDGGFGELHRRRDNMQRSNATDVESLASSHSTLPINKVGLPLGSDNHGYDDGPYTIYGNVPPPAKQPRANTQV